MTEEAAEPAESDSIEETEPSDDETGTPASDTGSEEPSEAAPGEDGPSVGENEGADDGGATETGEIDGSDLAGRIAEYDDELAEEVRALEDRAGNAEAELDERESEIEDLTARLKRNQADFQNYKKRAKKRQEQLKERATEDLVERLVTVRDNLIRALDQDEGTDIRGGVESTLKEFDRILESENVAVIEPEPGEEVDPHRHEVMMRVDSDQPEGAVADVYQPGYEMGERVIRAAQVTVSDDSGA